MFATLNDLIRAAGTLKSLKRSGWVKKAQIMSAESVADHSYRMAVLGIVLGLEMKLDSAKITRMCLIHDLAESVIGDLMPEEKKNPKEHRRREYASMRKILRRLPRQSKRLLNQDWKELVSNKSKEARLVWQLDKLEMGLQMKDYHALGISAKLLEQFDPSGLLSNEIKLVLDKYRQ